MTRLFPLITALLLVVVVLSCSDNASTPPQDTVTFTGTVRDGAAGTPMEGADVLALRHDNGKEVARTASGSDGAFAFTSIPKTAIDLLVQKNGYTARRVENIDPTEQIDPENTGLNVRLIPTSEDCCDALLTLTVKDANGNGIPQAKVQIKKNGNLIEDPRTDANGVVLVDQLCPGSYTIRVARDGYRVYEAAFVINETCDPVTMTAVLETAQICCSGVFTLLVKTSQGAAIPGATVHLWKGGGILATMTSDANGYVTFDSLCTGSYGVNVSMQGYEARELTFSIGENCAPVEKFLVLEAPACCDGEFTMTVRDNNNNPIEGAKVLVKKNGVVKGEALTNSSGVVVINNLCEGGYTYRVSKEGWTVREGEFAINSSCDPVTRDVTMEQTQQVCCSGVLALTVKDANGNPVQGAKVLIKKAGKVVSEPVTNEFGIVNKDGLCAGEYTYRISKDGWQVLEGSFAINSNCDPVSLVKTMEQTQQVCCSGVLTLTVLDANSNPVQGAKVYIRKGGAVVSDPLTDANGQVTVSNLCAGAYSWKIAKDGFALKEGSFAINENCDPVSATASLVTDTPCCSGVLTVTVKDASNNPVADAEVKLWKNSVLQTTVLTNSSGVAVVDSLCKGSYGVDVSKTGLRTKEFTFSINASCDPFNKTIELVP